MKWTAWAAAVAVTQAPGWPAGAAPRPKARVGNSPEGLQAQRLDKAEHSVAVAEFANYCCGFRLYGD